VLDTADAYIERNGLDLPQEPQAWAVLPNPQCLRQPLLELDLIKAGVTSIIWATGFSTDYSWLKVDAFDEKGKPQHQRGVSSEMPRNVRPEVGPVCRVGVSPSLLNQRLNRHPPSQLLK
jgi:hypothetical protein